MIARVLDVSVGTVHKVLAQEVEVDLGKSSSDVR